MALGQVRSGCQARSGKPLPTLCGAFRRAPRALGPTVTGKIRRGTAAMPLPRGLMTDAGPRAVPLPLGLMTDAHRRPSVSLYWARDWRLPKTGRATAPRIPAMGPETVGTAVPDHPQRWSLNGLAQCRDRLSQPCRVLGSGAVPTVGPCSRLSSASDRFRLTPRQIDLPSKNPAGATIGGSFLGARRIGRKIYRCIRCSGVRSIGNDAPR